MLPSSVTQHKLKTFYNKSYVTFINTEANFLQLCGKMIFSFNSDTKLPSIHLHKFAVINYLQFKRSWKNIINTKGSQTY